MELRLDPQTRDQLDERRRRLDAARRSAVAPIEIAQLLRQVDDALARFDAGTYGICESCHEPIEASRLRVDPLTRFCLDHLNETEQRALERDLELAADVQRRLLPKTGLATPEWDIHFRYEPLGPVSGDYCDVMMAADRTGPLVAVGDVSGKGVAASLLSAHLNALLRTLDDVGLGVRDMLVRANRLFCESTAEFHYATLVLARAGASGEIEVTNAAQSPPLIVRSGRVEALPARGLPLGMFCEVPYGSERVTLERGEIVLFCTDGVTEARSPDGTEFGVERLSETLVRARGRSASETVEACLDALQRFRSGAPPHDDVTLLALRRR